MTSLSNFSQLFALLILKSPYFYLTAKLKHLEIEPKIKSFNFFHNKKQISSTRARFLTDWYAQKSRE